MPRPFLPGLAGLMLAAVIGCGSESGGVAYTAAPGGGDENVGVTPAPEAGSTAAVPSEPPASPVDDEEFAGAFAPPVDPTAVPDEEEFVGGFVTPAAAQEPDPLAPPPGSAAALALANEPPAEPRELELLVPESSFATEPGGALRVSFDDLDLLRVLNAEPVPEDVVDHFPHWLAGLDGKEVRLRGFMYPTFADPVKAFVLARDNQICCFGRNPKPYDLVTVKLAAGEESRYIQNRPFDVAGTFRIDPVYDGGEWLRLYRIDGARVID